MSELSPQQSANASPTVLILEDNPSDLRLLQEAFEEAGSEIALETVANGDDAVDMLKERKTEAPASLPDLVLADLHVPGRDGHAVLEAIRADPALDCLPVILLTRSEDSENIRRCYESGANAYLTKPAEFAGLVSLVKAVEAFWIDLASHPEIPR